MNKAKLCRSTETKTSSCHLLQPPYAKKNSQLEVEAQILRSSNADLQAKVIETHQEYDTFRKKCADHLEIHKDAIEAHTTTSIQLFETQQQHEITQEQHEITQNQLTRAEEKLKQLEDVRRQLGITEEKLKLSEQQKRLLIEVRDLSLANADNTILAEDTVLVDDNQAAKSHSEDQDRQIADLKKENKTLQEENRTLEQNSANRAPLPSIPTFTAPPPPVLVVAPLPPTLAVAPLPSSSTPIIPPLPPTPAPASKFLQAPPSGLQGPSAPTLHQAANRQTAQKGPPQQA